MRRFSLIAVVALVWIAPANALAAEAWTATQVAGEVRVEIAGAPAVPLKVSMAIASDALIETAASGTATLTRGEDRIIVAGNSRLRLPADDAKGFTRVIEQFGELFFQVSKRTQPHFRVETPLLAATVKGTSFTVTVGEKGTNVQVREGLVLVQNSTSADQTYVAAGRSASVGVRDPMTLYLDRTIVTPSNLRLGDGERAAHLSAGDPAQGAPVSLPGAVRVKHTAEMMSPSAAAQIVLGGPAAQRRRSSSNMVLDSTLSGIGVGILAAALAIVFIGTNRRRPGLAAAKPRRASKKSDSA